MVVGVEEGLEVATEVAVVVDRMSNPETGDAAAGLTTSPGVP